MQVVQRMNPHFRLWSGTKVTTDEAEMNECAAFADQRFNWNMIDQDVSEVDLLSGMVKKKKNFWNLPTGFVLVIN
jgi:hypothetical protein